MPLPEDSPKETQGGVFYLRPALQPFDGKLQRVYPRRNP
jgi:hypothetical protein